KDKDFWKYISKFDFVSLCETWLEENEWNKLKDRLPSSHKWECVYARREKKRGRAIGGFIIGVKKERAENTSLIYKKEEGVIMSTIDIGEMKTKNISVQQRELKKLRRKIRELLGNMEKENIVLGGDFNTRTGELGSIEWEEEEIERRSKDKVIGNGGKELVDWAQKKGWYILNGTMKGDWEGEYTYIGYRR
ncbi:hypothetical protein ALC57_02421, partial [Trachymyrmex cornetzi]